MSRVLYEIYGYINVYGHLIDLLQDVCVDANFNAMFRIGVDYCFDYVFYI